MSNVNELNSAQDQNKAKIDAEQAAIERAKTENGEEDLPYIPISDEFLHFEFTLYDTARNPITYKGHQLRLVFKVHPQSFDRSYKKLVSREQTRGGWVEYHGGDDLDIINVNGVSGAFVSDKDGSLISIGEGRTTSHEREWVNELLSIFRSNANSFDSRGFVYRSGIVHLSYDIGEYEGKFESLTITDNFEKPYSLDYNFTFVVERTIYSVAGNLRVYNSTVKKGHT